MTKLVFYFISWSKVKIFSQTASHAKTKLREHSRVLNQLSRNGERLLRDQVLVWSNGKLKGCVSFLNFLGGIKIRHHCFVIYLVICIVLFQRFNISVWISAIKFFSLPWLCYTLIIDRASIIWWVLVISVLVHFLFCILIFLNIMQQLVIPWGGVMSHHMDILLCWKRLVLKWFFIFIFLVCVFSLLFAPMV